MLFECKKGFRLVGDRRIKCLATGRWSNNPPVCIGMSRRSQYSAGDRIVINQNSELFDYRM